MYFQCVFDDDSGVGITSIKIIGSRVIAAHLHGTLDFLQLQTYSQGKPIDWNFTCAYRRTHIRTGSAGSIADHKDVLQVMKIYNKINMNVLVKNDSNFSNRIDVMKNNCNASK